MSSPAGDKESAFLTVGDIRRCLQAAYQPGKTTHTDGYAGLELQFDESLKCAAVLMPLVWNQEQWHLLFTRRTEQVESHKGQVSFPGGQCEHAAEEPEAVALRELEEEIGVPPQCVQVLGRLNDMLTITRYRVTPVVGVIPWPYEFNLSAREVSRVFTIPLKWLAERRNWEQRDIASQDRQPGFPVIIYHPYDGEVLWGATARMTHSFLQIMHLYPPGA